jgi:membrane-bound lytic murein transglycosylase D
MKIISTGSKQCAARTLFLLFVLLCGRLYSQDHPAYTSGERAQRFHREEPSSRFLWHGETKWQPEISGQEHELTRQYIARYSAPAGLAWLKTNLKRAEPYLPFILQETDKRGLPQQLALLPVIESNFIPRAMSRSGASGLWQFMENSIAPFDIKIDEWMDERRDFWKATEAALSKLEENYRYFGDWALALAAYNMGLGALRRICSETGIKDYWTLVDKGYLKTETAHYVPKLLAVSCIFFNKGDYGLEASWPEEIAWTRISPGRSVDLELLAKAADIDPAVLTEANAELFYNVTPPDPDYLLKVPSSLAPRVEEVLARAEEPLIRYYFYTIRSGDTLSAVAVRFKVSVNLILQANPGLVPERLQVGLRIKIPAVNDHKTPASDFSGTHLVKQGETLRSIALAYDVDAEALAEANNISVNAALPVGKVLKTPIKE